jgi:hypothetical protein
MIIGCCVIKHYIVVNSGLSENLYMLISVINSPFRGIPSGKSMRLFGSSIPDLGKSSVHVGLGGDVPAPHLTPLLHLLLHPPVGQHLRGQHLVSNRQRAVEKVGR